MTGAEDDREQRLRAARIALYRRDAGAAERADYAELVATRDGGDEPAPALPPRARRRRMGIVAGAALGLAAVTTAGLVLARPLPRVDAATAPLARVLAADPGLLPGDAGDWRLVTSDDVLDGSRALTVSVSGPLLLVVRCPVSDDSFVASEVSDDGSTWWTASGACGRLRKLTVPNASGDRSVYVTTRGVSPFSAALLARRA